MARKRRLPRADEMALWKRVADRTTPLARTRPDDPVADLPVAGDSPPETRQAPEPVAPFMIGSGNDPKPVGAVAAPPVAERLSRPPVRMDVRAFGKLIRGKMEPEARIDLHGMTLAQAHSALTGFVLNAQVSGKRLVLVITGKGRLRDDTGLIPERHGVLRHQVPDWLRSGVLRSAVLQIAPAHRKHGGSGACYVYLRRNR